MTDHPARPVAIRVGTVVFGCIVIACSSAGLDEAVVSVSDVHRFVDAEHRMTPADSTCGPFDSYFSEGTAGLSAYARKFSVGRTDLCAAFRKRRARYVALDTLLPALDSAAAKIRNLFARFKGISQSAKMPDVYVVVGTGIAGGTTIGWRSPKVLIGAELLRSATGLPWTVAHELGHTQQDYSWWGALTGGPTFLRATLLRQSITEGVADVVAEVLTGEQKRSGYGEAHEAALWVEFQRDMHRRDYGGWLYNGRSQRAADGRPADIGYWVGYRIARAYYDRGPDKSRALHEMLTIRDFDAFLVASGYPRVATLANQHP